MGWKWIGDVGHKAGPATMTSRACVGEQMEGR